MSSNKGSSTQKDPISKLATQVDQLSLPEEHQSEQQDNPSFNNTSNFNGIEGFLDKQTTGTFNFADSKGRITIKDSKIFSSEKVEKLSHSRLRLSEEAQSIIDSLTQFIENEKLVSINADELETTNKDEHLNESVQIEQVSQNNPIELIDQGTDTRIRETPCHSEQDAGNVTVSIVD